MSGPRHWLSWLAVAALVAVAVGTAGWGNETPVRRHPSAPVPRSVTVSSVHPIALVARADLVRADVASGYREIRARAGGDLDRGDVLRVCGEVVPRPLDRVASHRRAFLGPRDRRIRTEVGVYRRDGAARALDALRDLAARCAEPVPPGHVELPSVLALHVRLAPSRAHPGRRDLVALRSGDALTVLEDDGAGLTSTIELSRVLAARLP